MSPSSSPAPPPAELLAPPRAYALADDAERAEQLRVLAAMLAAAPGPMLVRHLPAQASTGRPRVTTLAGAPAPWPVPAAAPAPVQPVPAVRERAGWVELADGRVGQVLALTRWPAQVDGDWLAPLGEVSDAVVVHAAAVAPADAARLLRRRLGALVSTGLLDERAGRVLDPTTAAAEEAAARMWAASTRGTTRLLAVQVLLAISADAPAGLAAVRRSVRTALAGLLAAAQVCRFEQGPAWRACGEDGAPLARPWRLVPAAVLAATLPHPVGPAGEPGGVDVGVDPRCGAPVRVDRFALANPHRIVVGTSGAGKSYAAKLECLRWVARGAHAVVLDPEGEFGALAGAGGLALAVGEEPAGLDPVALACSPALTAGEGLALLCSFAGALTGRAMSGGEAALLDRALGVLRADRRASPTLVDLCGVCAELGEHPPHNHLVLPAELAATAGSALAGLFAPNPDLADPPPLVVFDLRAVPDPARGAVTATALAWAWARRAGTGTGPDAPLLVVVDEAHLLLGAEPAAALLAQFARRARKYRIGLELVTQRLSDFLTDRHGAAVLAATATKLLLGCEDHERAAVAAGLGLSRAEAQLLRPGPPGAGLLLTPRERTPVHVRAGSDAEHGLAAAGPRRSGRPW